MIPKEGRAESSSNEWVGQQFTLPQVPSYRLLLNPPTSRNSFCPNSYPYMGTMNFLDIEVDLPGKEVSVLSWRAKKAK